MKPPPREHDFSCVQQPPARERLLLLAQGRTITNSTHSEHYVAWLTLCQTSRAPKTPEPWRHQLSRMTRSEIHGVAGESVLQAFPRSRLLQRPLISRLPQQLRETALVLGQSAQLGQALLQLLNV